MARERVAADWLASLGPRRGALAVSTVANGSCALGLVLSVMARARVAAAWPHTAAASWGCRRAVTTDSPCANAGIALASLVFPVPAPLACDHRGANAGIALASLVLVMV